MRLRAAGTAPVETVWRRYVTPGCWPEWSPQIRAVRVAGDRVVPGLRGEIRTVLGVGVPFVVEAVDEERRIWSWRVRLGPVRLRLRHEVRERPGGGALTELRVTGPVWAVAGYAPLARLALRRLVRR
ncbi:SRPBCC family protein [Streptomyces sp. LP05-1]|uniref:SRPBCC family protein n=1 Tax=Streptomyces pyxinae TaxID=2970734 RepID=A0ABT2CDI8_9ACTN|nr:SRPBCC family protein [Streptomyces sp. LP05-1]MCS0635467.1 SRPBCC family protein [Streptomyces sp. LP05-1]